MPVRPLLLTDVVDSTRLSEELGDAAMADLWAAHDRVARDLLVAWRGREIDKTDGFLLLFDDVADAVAYAIAYHRALSGLSPPIAARAGVHVGPVLLRENAPADVARGAKPLEVEGIAKPLAARVMSVAGPGQTLITADARQALGETDLRVVSHGHWRMKGLAEPVELFEVGGADAPFAPPADAAKVYRVVPAPSGGWRPAREVPHRLPAERDVFVGRREDLKALADALDRGARLVNVLGPGGAGKTRLAVAYAWRWLGDWTGGAWFCDLAEARDEEGVVIAVSRALGAPVGAAGADLVAAIAARGSCLLVLDNFEQVAAHAAATVGRWLDGAAEARFVVTSREVLGLPGEVALPLEPLSREDAIALFDLRARDAHRAYEPDPQAVAELVALLDDLPLAIELAAARVRMLPPRRLVERMSDRFRLLAVPGGRRDRQATLRATLDWSWDLLLVPERAGLARLSAFAGGFDLAAVESVLEPSPDAPDAPWPGDVLQSLIDKSLVRRVDDERFDLLVSVQAYAAEQARALGLQADADRRHARWCLALPTDPIGPRALRERDNLWAACRRAVDAGDGPLAAALLERAFHVLLKVGPAAGGALLAAEIADRVAGDPRLAWGAHWRASLLWSMRATRSPEALRHAEAAVAVADQTADLDARVRSRNTLALQLALRGGLDRALALLDPLRREVAERGDTDRLAMLLGNCASLAELGGQIEVATALAQEGLAHARAAGLKIRESSAHNRLSRLYARALDFDRARGAAESAVALVQGLPPDTIWTALAGRGDVEARAVDAGRAAPEILVERRRELLAFARTVGSVVWECEAAFLLASALYDAGRMDEAGDVAGGALPQAAAIGRRDVEGKLADLAGAIDIARGREEEAAAHLERARRTFVEANSPGWAELTSARLALLERSRGRPGAPEALLRARDAVAALGESRDAQYAGARSRLLASLDAILSIPALSPG